MRVGVMALMTEWSIGPIELARAVEERGLASMFVGHHTNIPTSRATPYPAGGELREEFRDLYDPLAALAAAAAVTSRIELGTGVLLIAQVDPIVAAKQIATIDQLSGGRFVLGIGFGWNHDELRNHGIDPSQRRDIVRERIAMMKSLWTEPVARFDGQHEHLADCWMGPKPIQKPHPPILMGGAASETLFHHVVDYCDGWIPIGGAGLAESLQRLHEHAERNGRDPATLSINVFGPQPDPARLDRYAELGVDRVVLTIPPVKTFSDLAAPSRDEALTILDSYAELAATYANHQRNAQIETTTNKETFHE